MFMVFSGLNKISTLYIIIIIVVFGTFSMFFYVCSIFLSILYL